MDSECNSYADIYIFTSESDLELIASCVSGQKINNSEILIEKSENVIGAYGGIVNVDGYEIKILIEKIGDGRLKREAESMPFEAKSYVCFHSGISGSNKWAEPVTNLTKKIIAELNENRIRSCHYLLPGERSSNAVMQFSNPI